MAAMEEIAEVIDGQLQRFTKDLHQGLQKISQYSNTVTVFGSARFGEDHPDYIRARELGGLLAKSGHTVVTGGSAGIMEAANRGAFENGGNSVGLNIQLPKEQNANPYTTDSLSFRYFAPRKIMLSYSSNVFVVFPGGFGTLDEMYELLVLVQTHKVANMPMVLFGKEYWSGLMNWTQEILAKRGMIDDLDTSLVVLTDDPEEAVRVALSTTKTNKPKK